jgi:hypothetical protein
MGEIITPGQWDDLCIYLKRKHPNLTDNDMPYYEAEEQDLLCMIEYKIHEIREERLSAKHNFSIYSSLKEIDSMVRKLKSGHELKSV